MNETYQVGEIAIFWRPGSRFHAIEVAITKALHLANVFDHRDGSRFLGHVYGIDAPEFRDVQLTLGFDGSCALPEHLRKKPPKQDWKQLCGLQDNPIEAPVRELETA